MKYNDKPFERNVTLALTGNVQVHLKNSVQLAYLACLPGIEFNMYTHIIHHGEQNVVMTFKDKIIVEIHCNQHYITNYSF